MGKIKQGILGGFSGKVGTVVGVTWKGISYMRALATSVANPRTEGQVNQRNKFAATIAFLQPNLAFLKVGYKFYATQKSAFNAAMAYVIKNAITGTAPDFSVDYASALVSRGKLTGASGGDTEISVLDLTISWTDNQEQGNASADDVAMLLAYNPTQNESVIELAGPARSAASGILELPSHFTGDSVEVYLAFQSADGSMVSNSTHLGTVVVPV